MYRYVGLPVLLLVGSILCLSGIGCNMPHPSQPPVATKQPHLTTIHDVKREDDYYWLRDKNNPATIDYLKAENAYTEAVMAHTKGLQDKLFKEMKGRIKETDVSAPVKDGPYYYYERTEEGKQYRIHCRKKGSLNAIEEVLLNENELAAGHDYFRVGNFEVSPDHRLLAYAVDMEGDETYTLRVKDLATGKLLPDEIQNTYYSVEWSSDCKVLFYTILDESMRPFKAFRHVLGDDSKNDVLVYHEPDDRFYVTLSKTLDQKYILVSLESQVTSEVRFFEADKPTGELKMIQPRQQNMEYNVAHHEGEFYIVTNDGGAVNFKLVKAPVATPDKSHWSEVIGHRADVRIESVEAFKDFMVIYDREAGLQKMRVRRFDTGAEYTIDQPEPVYSIGEGDNREYDSKVVRFEYMSLVTPPSALDYDMETRTRTLVKQQEVLGGYDPAKYESRRLFATASDGTRIPISIVYRKGMKQDSTNPTLLYGYGAYGLSMDPWFSSNTVSLLDRGFVYAIAHIRGGQEMGRPWYENGKLLKKKNTFTDFAACAEDLIAEKYTSREKLAIMGGSAGGLLMGAVTNLRPDLFRAVVAQVPFVDVITTMLDASLPLTVIEYEEWGNPNEKASFDYMSSYSPIDNVRATNYPSMLITAGLNDPRVGYWEPAKWAAKLRATKTDHNVLLLKTEMGAGHGGKSGRYDKLHEVALEFAFLLDVMGIKN